MYPNLKLYILEMGYRIKRKEYMDLIKKIQQLGLSKREAEVYMALLQKSELVAPEIAKITTVTRTKIYEILQILVRKGMCNETNKNGQKYYRVIKPDTALQREIQNIELKIDEQKKTNIEKKKKALFELEKKINQENEKIIHLEQRKASLISLGKELFTLYETGQNKNESFDYIEVLTNVDEIRNRWLENMENSKFEILMFTKPPYSISFEDNLEYESSLLKEKRIVFKSLYEYNKINTDEEMNQFIKFLDKYEKIGEEIRLLKELPMKLVIIDGAITMLALNDRISLKSSITTIIVDHPSFAISLKCAFDSFWQKGISLNDFKKDLEKFK